MNDLANDTIVAIATPPGRGGVGIVRMSGPQAYSIGTQIFCPRRLSNQAIRSHHLVFGNFVDPRTGIKLDEGLFAYMRGPHSYTGEDVVELNAHGSPFILDRIVDTALFLGARGAEPGELTMRAFLNGRLDLAQAESVADLIAANSETAARLALNHLTGQFSIQINQARTAILQSLAPIEATIDFPEDEVPPPECDQLSEMISHAISIVEHMVNRATEGKIMREGIQCAIIGRPNVGKSSLLNALLGIDRAIVTPIAGTTRDTIEEIAIIDGVACNFIDTAGLMTSNDIIEKIGMERSRTAMKVADLVLLVLDSSQPLTADDDAVMDELLSQEWGNTHRRLIVVANKCDLPAAIMPDTIREAFMPNKALSDAPIVTTSLINDFGLQELKATILAQTLGQIEREDLAPVARARHRDALRQSLESLTAASQTLEQDYPLELVAEDLHDALHFLGVITGETVTGDLLETIFSEFCIGK
jgi:tRNA modification GTPase